MPSWLPAAACDQYAVVLEGGGDDDSDQPVRNATVCGRRRRQAPVYLSESNVVQVRVDVAASRSHRFVLKYQGLSRALRRKLIYVYFRLNLYSIYVALMIVGLR